MLMAAYKAEVEYRGHSFRDDEATKTNIDALAESLTAENPKCGFLLSGNVGNGKTTLVYAFQNLLNYLTRHEYLPKETGLRILDAKEIQLREKDLKAFQPFKNAEMLAIEDLGKEPAEVLEYGNVLSPVCDLLEYRYDRQLFTVVTTNLTPKERKAKYGDRIADRFREMFASIVFENPSYRA